MLTNDCFLMVHKLIKLTFNFSDTKRCPDDCACSFSETNDLQILCQDGWNREHLDNLPQISSTMWFDKYIFYLILFVINTHCVLRNIIFWIKSKLYMQKRFILGDHIVSFPAPFSGNLIWCNSGKTRVSTNL